MDSMTFDWQKCGISDQEIAEQAQCVDQDIDVLRAADYTTPYGFVCLPTDKAIHNNVVDAVKSAQQLKPSVLIVIGIGGSNLGTFAVLQALRGTHFNDHEGVPDCYFVDTIDPDEAVHVLERVRWVLEHKQTVLVNVISKSGTTTETMINFELFAQLLKLYHPDTYQDYIVVTTDEGSPLWQWAQQHDSQALAIPKYVGGRYSVLSPVGLFPLQLLGIDVVALCRGADKVVRDVCAQGNASNVVTNAAILAVSYQRGFTIHSMFLFSPSLHGVGLWYRQLLAESIGKEFDRDGNKVEVGFLPSVDIGTTDLHSMVQRYLGGPRDVITTFVGYASFATTLEISTIPGMPQVQEMSVAAILKALFEGTQQAYAQMERPYMVCTLAEKNAYTVGQFLQWKMIETALLGSMLNVNPFDQANVELYKDKTRKILSNG